MSLTATPRRLLPVFARYLLAAVAALWLMLPQAYADLTPAQAAGLNLGTAANYVFVDLGKSTLGWNTGPLDGDVLFGQGLTAKLSGGNDGGLTAGHSVYYDNSATITGSLQNPITKTLVPVSTTAQVHTDADAVSTYASSLAATQTFSSISGTTTITSTANLNVIDVKDIHNATLRLNGSANDYFVFNVSGAVNTNRQMILSGGLLPSHIIFNLTGTGTVFQTSGGNLLYGTFLATNGGAFQFSELDLKGSLINIGGNVQLVSGSNIPIGSPLKSPAVPEPTTPVLLLTMLLSVVLLLPCWRRRA